jgi:hypothetical protein
MHSFMHQQFKMHMGNYWVWCDKDTKKFTQKFPLHACLVFGHPKIIEAIHPTIWNEQESIIMSFCVIFNTMIRKGTKNTHNLINYFCLIVAIHKDVFHLDAAMDNFWITWQQIKKRLFFISDKQKLQNLCTNKQRVRTKNSQALGRWSSVRAAGPILLQAISVG